MLYRNFDEYDCRKPGFKPCAKNGETDQKGLVLYYTNQCPHTDKYAPIIQDLAKEKGIDLQLIKIDSMEAAQNAPTPFTTYSLFYDGKFVTNEILSEKRFLQIIEEHGL